MSNAAMSPQEIAQQALKIALSAGANQAAASCGTGRDVSLSWRDGKVESLSDSTTKKLTLEIYIQDRYSVFSSSDLRPEALKGFIEDAAILARALAKDPFRALPSPELYQGQTSLNLEQEDSANASVSTNDLMSLAQNIERAARAAPGHRSIISVTTNASTYLSESYRVHSNGFEGSKRASSFSLYGDVSVNGKDGQKPSGSDWAATRFFHDLPAPDTIGWKATARAFDQIGAAKRKTGQFMVVIENRAVQSLLRHFVEPLKAAALQQKRSFFDKKLGQTLASPLMNVTDNPFFLRGLGSRQFDDEGIAAKAFSVFETGTLRNFYIDNYYGKKLGMTPTTRDLSNLEWKTGTKSKDQLIADIGEGYLITGFLGGNSNGTTGDFSLGVNGFRIHKGKIAEPFSGMNLAGNHLEFWKHLVAVGNDPFPYSAARNPTLVFEGAQLAGS